MVSAALTQWRSTRACRLDRLMSAHVAVGGSGAGRRWATEELNHAIVLRLASEFQGFCRDLHQEAVRVVADALAPADFQLQEVLATPYAAARRLDRGNAEPVGLANDFGLLGVKLWPALGARYPSKSEEWRRKLELLNQVRNGLAHDDPSRLAKVQSAGWSPTLLSVRRWRGALDGLAAGMDRVTGERLQTLLNVTAW
jgi:hypothetical protein